MLAARVDSGRLTNSSETGATPTLASLSVQVRAAEVEFDPAESAPRGRRKLDRDRVDVAGDDADLLYE